MEALGGPRLRSDLNMPPSLSSARRVVVKIGTSVLTEGSPSLNQARMRDLARQCAWLHNHGREVLIVTSGASAAGKDIMGLTASAAHGSTRQMLSAVGQARLVWHWDRYLGEAGVHVGQILLSRLEIEEPTSYLNIQDTMEALIAQRIVPVINENDVIATPQVRVGDNDSLSAMVAVMMQADLLVLLTDQRGLYTRDPRLHADAELIPQVDRVDAAVYALAAGTSTALGTGGMKTKLDAAAVAQRAGIDVVITQGCADNVILRLARDGHAVGTRFPKAGSVLENRKKRILTGVPAGTVVVDPGARHALVNRGTSLLPPGITEVIGRFQRGDKVFVSAGDPRGFARGIVRYSSAELAQIKGRQSSQISRILGYDYGDAAIHRNDLVLL